MQIDWLCRELINIIFLIDYARVTLYFSCKTANAYAEEKRDQYNPPAKEFAAKGPCYGF